MKGNLSWSKAGTFVQITTDDDVVIARGWLYPEPPAGLLSKE